MLTEQRIKLSGHERFEGCNVAARHLCPFAVRAGQYKLRSVNLQSVQCAKDLNFFAAHHIRRVVIESGQARYDANAVFFNPLQVLRDVLKATRTRAVGRFSPPLSAARHPGNEAKCIGTHPIAKALFKNVLKLPMRHLQNALWECPFVQYNAIGAKQRPP